MTVGTAPELFPSIPEIKEWTRLINNELTDLTIDNNYYQVNSLAVDSNFFRLMDYPLIGCERDKVLNGTNVPNTLRANGSEMMASFVPFSTLSRSHPMSG